jgi:hypothetical protein
MMMIMIPQCTSGNTVFRAPTTMLDIAIVPLRHNSCLRNVEDMNMFLICAALVVDWDVHPLFLLYVSPRHKRE